LTVLQLEASLFPSGASDQSKGVFVKSLLVSARSIALKIVAGTIFVASILSGASPAAADTNGQLTYTVADGKASVTGCDGACSASIAVPSTLGGVPVTKIADSAFYD
jgi:hypothetical protein